MKFLPTMPTGLRKKEKTRALNFILYIFYSPNQATKLICPVEKANYRQAFFYVLFFDETFKGM